MSDTRIDLFGEDSAQWNVSQTDVARQAVAPLRGYVYQLHQSASAWIHLNEGEFLYLEVAEDFAQVLREPGRLDSILMLFPEATPTARTALSAAMKAIGR